MLLKSTFISALLLIGAAGLMARADVQFTRTSTYSFETKSPAGTKTSTSQEVIRYFISTNKERIEYSKENLMRSNETTITRCDLHQQYRIDNTLKIYTASALDAKGILHEATEKELTEDMPSGKLVTNYSLQKIASEKVNDIATQVYHIKVHSQYTGVLKNHESSYDGTMWVADVPGNAVCNSPKPLQTSYTQIENLSTGKRRITYENTGDIDLLNKISSQLIMRQEGTSDAETVNEQVSGYSTAKLDDSLFEVPAGYRKVTLDEYNKLRSQARIKKLRKKQDGAIGQ